MVDSMCIMVSMSESDFRTEDFCGWVLFAVGVVLLTLKFSGLL
jgi:hypothetical protein